MRVVWRGSAVTGYSERYVDVTDGTISMGQVGCVPERRLMENDVRSIIAGRSPNRQITAHRDGGYAVGCMRFPTHVVNAVCKELGVARPVVSGGAQ